MWESSSRVDTSETQTDHDIDRKRPVKKEHATHMKRMNIVSNGALEEAILTSLLVYGLRIKNQLATLKRVFFTKQ